MDVVTDSSSLYQHMLVEGFDAEALLGVVKDARFEQRLLGGGEFRAHVQRISFPGYSLDCGDYSLPVFASGSFGDEVVALALAIRCARPMWANGSHVECGRMVFFSEHQELDVRSSPGQWCWCVMSLPREMLIAEARYRHGYEPRLPSQGWLALEHARDGNLELVNRILETLRQAASWTLQTPCHEMVDAGRVLRGAFVDAMVQSLPARMRRRREGLPMQARHGLLIRRAENFLAQRNGQDFTVAALSAAIGIGERQLERIFLTAYGMGPCRWHHVARLNRARQLLGAARGSVHVTEVASGLGFGHLGRFSHDYRELFGEFPRDTLARRRFVQVSGRQ